MSEQPRPGHGLKNDAAAVGKDCETCGHSIREGESIDWFRDEPFHENPDDCLAARNRWWVEEIRRRFPWLGTNEIQVSGTDVIGELANWYAELQRESKSEGEA